MNFPLAHNARADNWLLRVTGKPFGTVRADLVHGVYPYDERASSTRCVDIQKIAGFRRSSGERLPAVPGGHVPPEREVQSEQRKAENQRKRSGARRGRCGLTSRHSFCLSNYAASFLSRNVTAQVVQVGGFAE